MRFAFRTVRTVTTNANVSTIMDSVCKICGRTRCWHKVGTKTRLVIVATVVALTFMVTGGTIANAATSSPTCPQVTWGSLQKVNLTSPGPSITAIRTGINTCFDRLVVNVGGPSTSTPTGWSVSYVSVVTAEGSGFPVNVPGAAKLAVNLSHPSTLGTTGGTLANVTGYPVFRSLIYGGSFEGYSTIGLGVRARLPFRVFALSSPPRIVIDVARSWNAF
jgi:hypothetical protein